MDQFGIQIQPLVAILTSSLIATRAYRKKSLDISGAISGFIVMSIHIAAGYRCAHSSRLSPPIHLPCFRLAAEKKKKKTKNKRRPFFFFLGGGKL